LITVKALDRLSICDNVKAAILALEALNRVDHAREISKNLKGEIGHDLRVSTAVTRHAILAICQRSSHLYMNAVASETIDSLTAELAQLQERTSNLRVQMEKERSGRIYLLERSRSRGVTPVGSPERPSRGKKRDLRERREVTAPGLPVDEVVEGWADPLVSEIVMGSPARGEEEPLQRRSLSPMARYAAADPQVMGVLQDVVESLRGLECRMAALEGRSRLPPAPLRGRGERATPAPVLKGQGRSRRRGRRKGGRFSGPQSTAPERVPRGARAPGLRVRCPPRPQAPCPEEGGPPRLLAGSPPARPSLPLQRSPLGAPRGRQVKIGRL